MSVMVKSDVVDSNEIRNRQKMKEQNFNIDGTIVKRRAVAYKYPDTASQECWVCEVQKARDFYLAATPMEWPIGVAGNVQEYLNQMEAGTTP